MLIHLQKLNKTIYFQKPYEISHENFFCFLNILWLHISAILWILLKMNKNLNLENKFITFFCKFYKGDEFENAFQKFSKLSENIRKHTANIKE